MLGTLTGPGKPTTEAVIIEAPTVLVEKSGTDHEPIVVIKTLGHKQFKRLVNLSVDHVERFVGYVEQEVVVIQVIQVATASSL